MKQSVKSNSLVKFEGLSTFLTQTVGRFDMWVDPIIILWKFSNELLRHESGSSGFLSTVFRGTTSFLCMFFIILCHFCKFFGFIIQDLETPKPDFFSESVTALCWWSGNYFVFTTDSLKYAEFWQKFQQEAKEIISWKLYIWSLEPSDLKTDLSSWVTSNIFLLLVMQGTVFIYCSKEKKVRVVPSIWFQKF